MAEQNGESTLELRKIKLKLVFVWRSKQQSRTILILFYLQYLKLCYLHSITSSFRCSSLFAAFILTSPPPFSKFSANRKRRTLTTFSQNNFCYFVKYLINVTLPTNSQHVSSDPQILWRISTPPAPTHSISFSSHSPHNLGSSPLRLSILSDSTPFLYPSSSLLPSLILISSSMGKILDEFQKIWLQSSVLQPAENLSQKPKPSRIFIGKVES